jgi:hypothetical protein
MSQQFDREINAADVADFLEQGLLENLVILFKAQPSLYPLIGELLQDERIGTRVGASALAETLADEDPGNVLLSVKALLPLLESKEALLRGDAAYLLGALGRPEALEDLRRLLDDEDGDVREAAEEAVRIIEGEE